MINIGPFMKRVVFFEAAGALAQYWLEPKINLSQLNLSKCLLSCCKI
jgi:hypothetical protein